MAIGVLSGLVMQWPIGWLSDHFDRRHVVTAIVFGAGLASLGLCVAGAWAPAALFGLVALFGGLSFTLYPQAIAHANDYASPAELVAVSAGLLMAHGVGAMAAPVLAGVAMDAFGPRALFALIAGECAALGVFCLYRMRQREPKPLAEQTPFAPVPDTTPLAAALDPRGVAPEAGAPTRETAQ
jgi:MFS family permease